MAPEASDAMCPADTDGCAAAGRGTQKVTRTPAAAAIRLGVFLMRPWAAAGSSARVALTSGDGEVDFARYGLRRELVGDFDFEPVVARRKRLQRHGLPRLELVAERHVERRRQRRPVEH